MVYRGHVEEGKVVFEIGCQLPEGTEVGVVVFSEGKRKTLLDRFQNIVGAASGLPVDMARNHDHYLHGAPQK